LSGEYDPRRILVFNWATMTYTLQASKLNGSRTAGTCALLKGNKNNFKSLFSEANNSLEFNKT
jgi:hypothetical protein